jgi:hypothetical protein
MQESTLVSSLEFSSRDSQWEDILSPDIIDKFKICAPEKPQITNRSRTIAAAHGVATFFIPSR